MKSVVLVIVLMGLAAASAMVHAENEGNEDFDWMADEQLVEISRGRNPVVEQKCPACVKHLTDMLTDATLNGQINSYCGKLPSPTRRAALGRQRCLYLSRAPEVADMVTVDMVKQMCKNGKRCS